MIRTMLALGALATSLFSTPAAAQDELPRTSDDHVVSLEVQARLGAGPAWVSGDTNVAGIPTGSTIGAGHLGASVALRHFGSGLGAAFVYSHVFMGIGDHYGTHAFELRLSERYTFFRTRRRHHLELSVLGEVGPLVATGGASTGCASTCGPAFVRASVPTTGVGVVGALGFLIQYDWLLIGLEVDARHIVGVDGPVDTESDVLGMIRIGIVVDLG